MQSWCSVLGEYLVLYQFGWLAEKLIEEFKDFPVSGGASATWKGIVNAFVKFLSSIIRTLNSSDSHHGLWDLGFIAGVSVLCTSVYEAIEIQY